MLKTLNTKSAKPRKSVIGVGCDNGARRDKDELDKSRIDDVEVENDEIGKKG